MKTNNNFIKSNDYRTPYNYQRSIWDRLSFGSPMYFGTRFLSMLVGSRHLALANKFDTKTWAKRSMDILYLTEDCGAKIFIEGLDNITSTGAPVVFISNHMSMMESMIFPGLIASRREVTFVVKKSLTSHSLFGPTMRARKPIAVDRKDPISDFKTVMSQGVEALNNGTSVVIFPQSKRMIDFDASQFNTLGIKLAKKANVAIIPVAIKTDFWGNGKVVKDISVLNRKEPVHIKFGEPIIIDGPGKKEHQKVIDFIQSNLDTWNNK